jgi:hypothetical protein
MLKKSSVVFLGAFHVSEGSTIDVTAFFEGYPYVFIAETIRAYLHRLQACA